MKRSPSLKLKEYISQGETSGPHREEVTEGFGGCEEQSGCCGQEGPGNIWGASGLSSIPETTHPNSPWWFSLHFFSSAVPMFRDSSPPHPINEQSVWMYLSWFVQYVSASMHWVPEDLIKFTGGPTVMCNIFIWKGGLWKTGDRWCQLSKRLLRILSMFQWGREKTFRSVLWA